SVGAGHIRAAEAVELAVRQTDREAHVVNIDVLDHATAAFRRVYGKAYLDLVNLAPHFLGWFYDATDRPPSPKSKRDRLRMLVQRASMPKFSKVLLGDDAPGRKQAPPPWDVVICT